ELDDLGLAAGLPDVFGGAAGEPPAVDRIEGEGADPAGLAPPANPRGPPRAPGGPRAPAHPDLHRSREPAGPGGPSGPPGPWRLAAADCRAALARRPDPPAADHALARLLVEAPVRGDAEEAVRRARAALGRCPWRHEYHRTLALALYRAGRLGEAAAAVEADI